MNLPRLRGIPLIDIQNADRLQGCNIYELNEALGEEGQDVGRHSAKTPSIPFFATQESAVAFPSSLSGQCMFPLTDLVRKMVQTVQKTS